MNDNEPIEPIEKDDFIERVIKKSGRPLPPDDPVVVFWETMLEVHKEFCEDIKNKNMMAVADALLTQQRFLKGYQKSMEHQLEYVVERAGTVFHDKLDGCADEGLKRNETLIRDGMNSVFGLYKQHLQTLKTYNRVLLLLIVLAALGVGGLYALLLKLFMLF